MAFATKFAAQVEVKTFTDSQVSELQSSVNSWARAGNMTGFLTARTHGDRVASEIMASASGDGRRSAPGRRPTARRPEIPEDANPTLRRRELGRRLRELRKGLGLTVEDVGEQLLCSATKISRLETGARRASLRDVRDLCRLYQVTDETETERLMALARQALEPGWWTKYEESFLTPLLGLEQEAVAITSFSMYYVPGLLQTGDYARAIIKGIERKIEPDALERRVEARLHRQLLLEKETPPQYRALLDEAVLRRQVGGSMTMQGQLDKMLACVRDEKAVIQVIPFEAGAHEGADSYFDLLEFGDDSQQRPVVFIESLISNRYFERPVEIMRYREALEFLRDTALSPRDSTSLITKIRNAHGA
jgi:transcriptional regulator with XRE-family HTH domain